MKVLIQWFVTLNKHLSLGGVPWVFPQNQERVALAFSQHFHLHSVIAQILSHRVSSFEEAVSFLSPKLRDSLPDPSVLPDMDVAVMRIARAILNQEIIAVWADYDVDGATSAAICVRFAKALGLNVRIYIPDRFREGYGLNEGGLVLLKEQGVDVVLVLDTGTAAFDVCRVARKINLDLVIIDHHGTQPQIPECVAFINPKRIDVQGNFQELEHLATVGLAFLFLIALNRYLRQIDFYQNRPEPSLIRFLDLVALGTVCDVMPLTGLNRVFVKQGLHLLSQRGNMGVRCLQDALGIKERLKASHLGFLLGPCINAGGRLGHSKMGVSLLTADHMYEAQEWAKTLCHFNRERRQIETVVWHQALIQAQSQKGQPYTFVWSQGWHEGVIGIIAGRLKEYFQCPALVVSFDGDMGKGSVRSIGGLDMGQLIHQAVDQGFLVGGGGHAAAGGFAIEFRKLEDFQKFIEINCRQFFHKTPFVPQLQVDQWITFQALSPSFLESLSVLEPYGIGNPQPRFAFADVRLGAVYILNQGHVKVTLSQEKGKELEALAFRCQGTPLGNFLLSKSSRLFDLVATISVKNNRPSLIIEDIRLS